MIRTMFNRWMNHPQRHELNLRVNKEPSSKAIVQSGISRPREFFELTKVKNKTTPDELGTNAKKIINYSKGKVFDIKA